MDAARKTWRFGYSVFQLLQILADPSVGQAARAEGIHKQAFAFCGGTKMRLDEFPVEQGAGAQTGPVPWINTPT